MVVLARLARRQGHSRGSGSIGKSVSMNTTMLKGIIHGKIIELEQEPGLPDGQSVTVSLQPVQEQPPRLSLGEGIWRSAGAWAEDGEELDEFLEWNRQQRKMGRREIEP
jgi:hypothetical protein